jgi:GLPGLI family protein
MKKPILLLFLLLATSLYSQNKTSKGKVEYNMITLNEDGINNYKAVLYFNEVYSRFVYSLKKDTTSKDTITTTDGNNITIKIVDLDTTAVSICTDKENKKIYSISKKNRKSSFYEDFVPQNWTITTEQKQIGKFSCRKATTSFRGRDYVGYYTAEIPISTGPFKFSGLPGLILELYDTKKEVSFEATLVAIPYNTNFEITFDTTSLVSREEFKRKMKIAFEQIAKDSEQRDRETESRSARDGFRVTSKSGIRTNKGIELD